MVRFDHHEDLLPIRVQQGNDFIMGVADLQGAWQLPAHEG
jgi:hypothetical protein